MYSLQTHNLKNSIRYGATTFFSNFREATFVSKDASDKAKEAARKKAKFNAETYAKLKKEKAQEIVTLLDLFGGEITLSEILSTDISLLNQLRDAKLEINRIQQREADKMSRTMQTPGRPAVKLTNPSTLTKKGNKQ